MLMSIFNKQELVEMCRGVVQNGLGLLNMEVPYES